MQYIMPFDRKNFIPESKINYDHKNTINFIVLHIIAYHQYH